MVVGEILWFADLDEFPDIGVVRFAPQLTDRAGIGRQQIDIPGLLGPFLDRSTDLCDDGKERRARLILDVIPIHGRVVVVVLDHFLDDLLDLLIRQRHFLESEPVQSRVEFRIHEPPLHARLLGGAEQGRGQHACDVEAAVLHDLELVGILKIAERRIFRIDHIPSDDGEFLGFTCASRGRVCEHERNKKE